VLVLRRAAELYDEAAAVSADRISDDRKMT
jgi:hypothetical protein